MSSAGRVLASLPEKAEDVNVMGDESPTSVVFLEHEKFSHVIFNKMEKTYRPGGDIMCFYKLTRDIHPQKKDWLGVFRVGWMSTREFYTFIWAPLPSDCEEQQQVTFKAYYLPKNEEDFYQFCYVDWNGVVRGASVPFQICQEVEEEILLVTTEGTMQGFAQQNQDLIKIKMELEELQLEKKNIEVKLEKSQESVTALERNNHSLQRKNSGLQKTLDTQTSQLDTLQRDLGVVKELRERLYQQNKALQTELDSLRSKSETFVHNERLLKKEKETMEAEKNCMQTELHQRNKQIENMRTEQEAMEKQQSAEQGAMNMLQSENLNHKREIERLVHDCTEKSKQLEHCRQENGRLQSAVTEQQTHKERLEEQLKQEQQHMKTLKQEKMNEVSSLKKEMEHNNYLIRILQMEKEDLIKENQKLKKEAEKVSAHFPGEAQFSSRNPASHEDVIIKKKCLKRDEKCSENVNDPDVGHPYRGNRITCPSCEQSFEASNKQVYDDHVLCHVLESSIN
ncbi:calcium-binding and coiled-coil domain-containing protein 2 isoform X2 [Microcaecilia unicolor]|uniref:Calcium-binding and coiled-coil domain-containing protein 2 n=1 Tax=Microcaecilia unicolor TaxID=1415580 RepID=A0A6P7ZV41_9AMPH|nr:calcium-binding and coiled-coil domain-containing protein 2 isoform X2 [Microcaecilia unicolor]